MRRIPGIMVLLAGSLGLLLSPVLAAEEKPVSDRVSFQVSVGQDVENDRVNAALSINAEHRNPADLADNINRDMQWALEQSRAYAAVRTRSGTYQTYPVYDERKIVRWRGRQDLQLESQDVDALSALVGALQERLQIQSLQFSVSPDKRKQVEEQLIAEALAAYQERAALIARSLGAGGYELLDVSIHTGGHESVMPMRVEAMAMGKSVVRDPAMESGTSRVTVQANGAIKLKRD